MSLIGFLGKGGLAHHPRGLVAHPVVFGGSPTTHIVVIVHGYVSSCSIVLDEVLKGAICQRWEGTSPEEVMVLGP